MIITELTMYLLTPEYQKFGTSVVIMEQRNARLACCLATGYEKTGRQGG